LLVDTLLVSHFLATAKGWFGGKLMEPGRKASWRIAKGDVMY